MVRGSNLPGAWEAAAGLSSSRPAWHLGLGQALMMGRCLMNSSAWDAGDAGTPPKPRVLIRSVLEVLRSCAEQASGVALRARSLHPRLLSRDLLIGSVRPGHSRGHPCLGTTQCLQLSSTGCTRARSGALSQAGTGSGDNVRLHSR